MYLENVVSNGTIILFRLQCVHKGTNENILKWKFEIKPKLMTTKSTSEIRTETQYVIRKIKAKIQCEEYLISIHM